MREYLTVTELNTHVDTLMQTDLILSDLWLKGEISGFKHHRQSGHFYFTLKDRSSAVSCVMFKSQARRVGIIPENGMEILARGRVAVYAPQGKYQLYVNELQPFGIGTWQLYLEQVRKKCEQAGYFATERKRQIPGRVNRVGIVTSQDGAAFKDILKVLRHRHPSCQVVLVHSAVQGSEAPRELAYGIDLLNRCGQVDVIIVGRGGGSLEDLLPFSAEMVVEAIFRSGVPVISAVGHEIDYSLADLAADVRAATPTQAAILAVPDMKLLETVLNKYNLRLKAVMERRLGRYMETLDRITMKRVWKQPESMVEIKKERLLEQTKRLEEAVAELIGKGSNRLALATTALDGVSPLKTMRRGYALVKAGDAVITSGEQVEVGDKVRICLQDADLEVEVVGKENVLRWKA